MAIKGKSWIAYKMGQKPMPLRFKNAGNPWGGRHKYSAVATDYNGVKYSSKREAAYAQELDLRVKAGELTDWERQIVFDLTVNGTKICRYIIDFREFNKDGSIMLTEVKGYPTPVFKLKWKLFRALYPNLNAQIIS